MSVRAADVVKAAPKYLGVHYSDMDCQAFVEQCLKDAGISKNLPGSNAWYREMTWVGTPEECKASFGKIPVGAFLFILKQDGGEPAKYKPDGIGNASHIGIYSGTGEGAYHSSASVGFVCESKFKGKSISGGWNRVGLWDRLEYDIDIPGNSGRSEKPVSSEVAIVSANSGSTVNMRKGPATTAALVARVPVGAPVNVIDRDKGWARVEYAGDTGYMMEAFLRNESTEVVQVPRDVLENMLNTIQELLK